MDLQMPVMDGYEAMRTLRKDNRFKSLPIIAMTAYAMKDDEQKCLDAGADAYITKPVKKDVVYTTLGEFIDLDDIHFKNSTPSNNKTIPQSNFETIKKESNPDNAPHAALPLERGSEVYL